VVISVFRKGHFRVIIRVVKTRQFWQLLLWLKMGSFGSYYCG